MKKLLLLIIVLFSVSYSFAQEEQLSEKEKARREKNIQAGNPFKRFGYTPKIATLSKGKYLEFHDLDSIVRIGSFTYNVKRKALIGYTKLDTVHPESTLRPEIISRWFSPDPLSDEFPSWSPYNFVYNNPVRFIDPDGRAAEDIIYIGNDGKVSRVEETDDAFNVFVMEETSQVLHLNDANGVDIDRYTNDEFQKGDRIFFPISDAKLNSVIGKAGKGKWYNLPFKSHSDADFTFSFLVPNYFGKDDTGDEQVYLEDGILRTHYEENHHYFKFGNDNKILNLYDAGNFMWGAWMSYSGFDYSTVKIGSEGNEGFTDAKADQNAIRQGFFHLRFKKMKDQYFKDLKDENN